MSEITVPDSTALLVDNLNLYTPAQINRSAWTGARKVVGLPGAELWSARCTIDLLATETEEQAWRAFLFALRGPANWFRMPVACSSYTGSNPTVASAATAYALPLTGIAVGLKAGSFLSVPLPSGRIRTVVLTADLASGSNTAAIVPALTEVPTTGVSVEVKNPIIAMSLRESLVGFSSANGVTTATFDVEETR